MPLASLSALLESFPCTAQSHSTHSSKTIALHLPILSPADQRTAGHIEYQGGSWVESTVVESADANTLPIESVDLRSLKRTKKQ